MRQTIQGHFDGRVIVPDGQVQLPVNEPLTIQVSLQRNSGEGEARQVREQALDRLKARALRGRQISADALRRERIYGDR